ncbi:dipeptidase [Rugamonas sp. CCM 8940]|uniref:dipeptidase n=1 Tax=Rugamonas sp. CCM 8940 TaxID=2765359 RepID=UPI0018F2F630|nr:dipeptidase [Rugamonas sp. CCM 8940]MBJ7311840.1 dipeptidase [Rugamonas sp. CCM 8940]
MLKKLAVSSLLPLLAGVLLAPLAASAAPPGAAALATADYALATYRDDVVESLERMVSFNTVADPAVPFERNPQQQGFKRYLREQARRLGFDFHDYGMVLVIGLGKGSERVGVITHGDVQPVDPSKWAKSPFVLDRVSEPGRLLGRGTEDDKGPIATALYAMKAIKDRQPGLRKRIELYVYMGEESDWAPLQAFLAKHKPPQMNITLDAEYPVVVAEKGWGALTVTMPTPTPTPTPTLQPASALTSSAASAPAGAARLAAFKGGFFGSQIPEDASAVIEAAGAELEQAIRRRAEGQAGMRYQFLRDRLQLTVVARGHAAHSSKPEDGLNAISMLADALNVQPWDGTAAAAMVNFLNDMVGTGLTGERFGAIAYSDGFMGPMTVAPTVLKQTAEGIELNINLRRPRGKSKAALSAEVQQAFDVWKNARMPQARLSAEIGDPWVRDDAPQLATLLGVFAHYTGIADAKPISIGGGTNSRLFPNAVSFGPAMPGTVYSGHSEHEFITEKQLLLNLQMYTAVLVELATAKSDSINKH